MSIFTSDSPEALIVQAIKQNAIDMLNTLKSNYINNYNLVWNNPTVTPDKIVASFGTDGQQLFQISAATAQLLTLCGVTGISTTMPTYKADGVTPWNYVANADGSVTLS